MTKLRPPLSIDAALERIASVIPGGWNGMAAVTGRKPGTVRAWGNPDRDEGVPLADAIAFDLAYQAAGGQGAPLFEVYALKLEASNIEVASRPQDLIALVSSVIKETAEAEVAMLRVARPRVDLRMDNHADRRDAHNALREVQEALVELKRAENALSALVQHGQSSPMPP